MPHIQYGNDVRLRIRSEYLPIYQELIDKKVITQNSEIFTLCANLGYKHHQKSDPAKLKDSSSFHFSSLNDYEKMIYLGVGFMGASGVELEKLNNASQMKTDVELFADAGMEYLIDSFLGEYLEKKEGKYMLIYNEHDSDLEKDLLMFIINEMETEDSF